MTINIHPPEIVKFAMVAYLLSGAIGAVFNILDGEQDNFPSILSFLLHVVPRCALAAGVMAWL